MDDYINKCKCTTNIKCKFCSEESKKYNLCESCNTEKGFYPKYDDENINSFLNCNNDETILCQYNYYLNNSKYFCTQNDICPNGFFLIKNIKKCINDCRNDTKYKYQYENCCYEKCPDNTIISEENILICRPCQKGECGIFLLNIVNNLYRCRR